MKNPIAPNTKIRILSPEHSEYVQQLAFEVGFSWLPGGKSIIYTDSKSLFFRGQEITRGYSENYFVSAEELTEIFIDLPTDAELEQAASGILKKSSDLRDKSGEKKVIEGIIEGQNPVTPKHSHYFKDVSDLDEVDVYRVCDLFEVNDNSGAIQHALKKLLCSGQRGAKGYRKDLEEARDSIQRKLDLMSEDRE